MFKPIRSVLAQGLRASAFLGLLAALCLPLQLFAQLPAVHHHYKLIDMGTFGGPRSYGPVAAALVTGLELNNSGVLVGFADTLTPDPTPPYCFNLDCDVAYAFQWQNGVMRDLGSLRHGWSSAPLAISANGLIAGYSENGKIDPLLQTAEIRAVLWQNGAITNLGTLSEGGYESAALAVNSAGEVVGAAMNTIPDASPLALYSIYPIPIQTTQTRAFLWDGAVMRDLGTLGGTDAVAAFINESGQVLGWSYTSPTQASACNPYAAVPLGSFIWDRKRGMRNLGNFGGTCTFAYGLNNHAQVVGWSSLPGDQNSRAFLWEDGVLQDLGGSLGGIATFAFALNEAGQAVGGGYLGGDSAAYFHAALWTKVGHITDLGTLGSDPCSNATDINALGQVVGGSISLTECLGEGDATDAFLWENGSIVDLNTLIPPASLLYLVYPDHINDQGEIAGDGVDASGNNHAFLLIPCDANHPDMEGCDYSLVDAATAAASYRPSFAVEPTLASQAERSSANMMLRARHLAIKRTH
jgi:probable HAF family extracellular repeat protein